MVADYLRLREIASDFRRGNRGVAVRPPDRHGEVAPLTYGLKSTRPLDLNDPRRDDNASPCVEEHIMLWFARYAAQLAHRQQWP